VTAAPDYVEAFEGWRAWRVVESTDGIHLHSIHYEAVWLPGEPLSAACHQRRRSLRHPLVSVPTGHGAPEIGCRCGIHAASNRDRAAAWAETLAAPYGLGSLHAIGTVALWGPVAEHTDGWRAGFAYPRALELAASARSWSPERLADIAEGLRVYGVPVAVVPVDGRARRGKHRRAPV
jgi:hypothetical protein